MDGSTYFTILALSVVLNLCFLALGWWLSSLVVRDD